MPQTKRKRRTKHRGTAAGTIEARGRTGRKPRPEEMRATAAKASNQRPARGTVPPTWKSAFAKACFGAVMLFAAMKIGILGKAQPTGSSAAFAAIAAVLYTPVMFATDKFIYTRNQKKAAPAAAKPKGR